MKNEAIQIAKKIAARKGYDVTSQAIETAIRTVSVKHARPYTLVTINNDHIGVAKYNPNDLKLGQVWKPHVGTQYALKRALEHLLRNL